jgi:methyltransferase family protein
MSRRELVEKAWRRGRQDAAQLWYSRWKPRRSAESRRRWIDRLRPRWQAVLRPFDDRVEYPFTSMPVLRSRHVERCRVVPHRDVLVSEHLPKGAVVAEVGTLRGDFTRVILHGARPRELHLVDLDFSQLDRTGLSAGLTEGWITLHQGDSATILSTLPEGHFDWIYLDADHSYEGVRRDIAAAMPKLKADGLLVFNDYTFWSHSELMEYGVIRAVNELCLSGGWEILYFALCPEMYCDVALRRTTA